MAAMIFRVTIGSEKKARSNSLLARAAEVSARRGDD
jgi:hypothetical protein